MEFAFNFSCRFYLLHRLCTLTITRLVLLKPLGPDVTTIMISVKMQSSKRTLRSNEISVPSATYLSPSGELVSVELDLTFSLQYPHFLKRSGNQLQIMLQRRKRYKNRAILGFKTLAGGIINMAEVLQRSNYMNKELELLGNIKEIGKNEIVARIVMSTVKSQPVDQDNGIINGGRVKVDRSTDVDSDEVDEFTSPDDGSDSETVEEAGASGNAVNSDLSTKERSLNQWRNRKGKLLSANNIGNDAANAQHRNFKQKFISLLKKFRIPDSAAFDSEEQYREALEQELMAASAQDSQDLDDLFEEEDVDELSDSGQEFDDISISSTPKPSLRPFFSSQRSLDRSDSEAYQ